MPDIDLALKDGAAFVTFNRPAQRNAMSLEMRQDLRAHLRRCAEDPDVKCVVLEGAGGHFMGGSDVRDFGAVLAMEADARRRYFEDRVTNLLPLLDALRQHPKLIVSKVRGACVGLGLGIVCASDLVYAAESAFFSAAYIHLGSSPDGGLTHELPRLIGPRRAMELLVFGERLPAPEAAEAGLINAAFPDGSLDAEIDGVVAKLRAAPTLAVAHTKRLLGQSGTRPFEAQMADEVRSFSDSVRTEDFAEGVRAFLEKRRASFSGR